MGGGRRSRPGIAWIAAAWVGGCALALAGSRLAPSLPLAAALAAALLTSFRDRRALLAVAGLLGALWTTQIAHRHLAARLPVALEGRTLVVSGRVSDLPRAEPGRVRFALAVSHVEDPQGRPVPRLRRISLSWYRPPAIIPRAGERWRFAVRLKRPRSLADPGGFDYAGWAFAHGIGATGYVYGNRASRLGAAGRGLTALRARIAREISATLGASPYAGLVAGLSVGARGNVSEAQWRTLRATGTTHLLAISGLHLGLIAAFVYLLVGAAVRRIPALVARVPARVVAAAAGGLAAVGYAALAGFSLPTQRALVMLALPFAALLLRRRPAVASALAVAALAVTLISPLAVMTAGFWLSFGAVAALVYGLRAARPGRGLVRAQLVVSLALVPLVAAFFGQISLVGPVANLIAIPVVGWAVVPVALTGAVASAIHSAWGAPFFHLAAAELSRLWPVLEWFAGRPHAAVTLGPASWIAVAAAVAGVACLLAPRGLRLRFAGAALLVPLFWPHLPARPAAGNMRVTVLDVGQGLAAVVTTAHHLVLVDTGPKWWGDNDAGRSVVIPFLRAHGLGRPDLIVLSHADSDHSGGLRSIEGRWPDVPVLTSVQGAVHRCHRGENWRWDDVKFEVLAPGPSAHDSRNNRSCVLKVAAAGGDVLFPGDIEQEGEHRLLATVGGKLASDVLIAPHHGSATSSTPEFVDAVHPGYVVFAVGYRNRYGFPRPTVVARYGRIGAQTLDSAHAGALTFVVTRAHGVRLVSRYRREHRRPWKDP